MHIHLIVAALALMLLALNLKASSALMRATCYERKQKVIQFMLVWLLPFVGGILVWGVAAQSYGYDSNALGNAGVGIDPCTSEHTVWTDNGPGMDGGGDWGGY